jgi:DNA-3-methyladenine glycosylase II
MKKSTAATAKKPVRKHRKISPDWSAARRHLRRDPVLAKIIAAVGPCTLKPRRDHFVVLCKAIYSQQISTKVAAVLFGRFRRNFPGLRPTPRRVIDFLNNSDAGNEGALRGCGLSRPKKSYLIDLATHFVDEKIPSHRLSRMSDDEVIESLTAVKGIGRWTAEMFLMFTLNRPDVLPVDDLGLQTAVQRAYGLKDRPKADELRKIAEGWAPYRSVATWYLWRSLAKAGAAKEGAKK